MFRTIKNIVFAWFIYEKFIKPNQNNNRGMGMVDTSNRSIKNGKEYDKYFPSPELSMEVINKNTSIDDTVKNMQSVIKQTLSHTSKIAEILKAKTIMQSLKNVFDFTLDHIKYKLDAHNTEQLRTPARSWHDRAEGIDCDCFSIFIASILENMGIDYVIRIADYGKGYQHVYIVAFDGNNKIILDPVILTFNYEKPTQLKKDYEN